MSTSPWQCVCLLLCLSIGPFGCWSAKPSPETPADEAEGPVWFEDVTDALGLDFVHDPGPTNTYFMPQSMGSGCAFLHDGDGTLYLYLLQVPVPIPRPSIACIGSSPTARFGT